MTKFAYSVQETAAALGVHPNTIRQLMKSGRLGSIRIGRRVAIPAVELERFSQVGVKETGRKSQATSSPSKKKKPARHAG